MQFSEHLFAQSVSWQTLKLDRPSCCGNLCDTLCFRNELEWQRKQHLENNPDWISDPSMLWTPEQEINHAPMQAREYFYVTNALYSGPVFTCLLCQQRISRPPPLARSHFPLLEAVAKANNQPDPRDDAEWIERRDKDMKSIWVPFFGY